MGKESSHVWGLFLRPRTRRIAAVRGLAFLLDSFHNAALIYRDFLRYESSLLGVVSLDSLDVTGVSPGIVA